MRFIYNICFWVGVCVMAIVMFIGAGYWWGKWEIRVMKDKVENGTTCGSCKKGTNQ